MATIKNVISTFLYTFKLLWKSCKFHLGMQTSFNLILGILPLLSIWVFQQLVNEVSFLIQSKSISLEIIALFLFQIFLMLLNYVIQQLSQIENKKMEYSFGLKIKEKIYEKIRQIPYITFENPEFQNTYARVNMSDKQIINTTNDIFSFFRDTISLVTLLVFLFSINWWFIPILVVGITPLVVINLKFGQSRYQLFRHLTSYGRKEGYIADFLSRREPLKEVRLYQLETLLADRWKQYFQIDRNKSLSLQTKQSFWFIISQVFLLLAYAVAGFIVITMISAGTVLIGSFVAVLQTIQSIQGTMTSISSSIASFYESIFYVAELRAFFNMEVKSEENRQKIEMIQEITVKNLSFYYPESRRPAIVNIDLQLSPGKKVAIVGGNGSGKTTLVKCLTGLYETKNSIYINGIPIEKVDLTSYHNRIAVLFQDYNQYEFPVSENIGFGKLEDIDNEEEIMHSARRTGIHSYISTLPEGYHSLLGRLFKGGNELSGGQWQRIALARSLFRRSDVIFLDEPTASLDPKSEVAIIENLFEVSRNQAVVYITHRLGAACLADEILVMKNGRIIERGTHRQLIDLNGEYSKMYRAQSKWYVQDNNKEVLLR